VLFGTDCPFDPEGGPTFIRESIRALGQLKLADPVRRKVYYGNAIRMLRLDAPRIAQAGTRQEAKARKKNIRIE
jgi:aminocarboxymuconate-semialdehyde decarboxylase